MVQKKAENYNEKVKELKQLIKIHLSNLQLSTTPYLMTILDNPDNYQEIEGEILTLIEYYEHTISSAIREIEAKHDPNKSEY